MAIVLNGTTGFTLPLPLAYGSGGTGLSSPGSIGNLLTSNGTGWTSAAAPTELPTQTGYSGYYLTTNGSAVSWASQYPTQTGHSGYYLTTNGSTVSWAVAGVTATDDTSTDTSYYPALFTSTSGSQTSAKVSSTSLYFNPSTGTLNSTVFNSTSDVNKKTNIRTILNALDIVKGLNGVQFDWKDSGTPSAGLIAQDVEQYLPELVIETDGVKSLNYNGIIGVLVEAIKQQQKQINELRNNGL